MNWSLVLKGFTNILFAPLNYPEMIWISIPLVATLILMELYLGIYKEEEMSWAGSLSNSLVLVFVGLDLMRKQISLFPYYGLNPVKIIIALAVLALGVFLSYSCYYHKIHEIAKKIFTSILFINSSAYLAVVFVYANFALNFYHLFSALLFILLLWIVFKIIHLFERKKKSFS